MQDHLLHVRLPVSAGAVIRLLASEPTSWLRRFLRLALVPVLDTPGVYDVPGWYRLGKPIDEGLAAVASLVWWPHAGDKVFESFRGELTVSLADRQTVVTLSGTSHGGTPNLNEQVLQSALELVGAALLASQSPDG